MLSIYGNIASIQALLNLTKPDSIHRLDREDDYRRAHENLQASANKQKEQFDRKRRDTTQIAVGTFVVAMNNTCRKPRIDNHFAGPYKVIETISGDRYRVVRIGAPQERKMFAKDQLRVWPKEWTADDLEFLFEQTREDKEPGEFGNIKTCSRSVLHERSNLSH